MTGDGNKLKTCELVVSTENVVATERVVTVETTATVPETMIPTRKTLHTDMYFYTIAISGI